MKILIVSREAGSVDMAIRLAIEGNRVRFAITGEENVPGEWEHYADGLVHKVKDWKSEARKSDLIFFDDSCMAEEMHKAKIISRETGVPLYGCAMTEDDIELGGKKFRGHEFPTMVEKNRGWLHGILRGLGCGTETESISFSDMGEAVKHLKEHDVPHAIKPEVENSGESYSYVSELPDGSDGIGFLETLPDRPGAGAIKSVEVEEKILGEEVAVQANFNGREFIGPVKVTFEQKKTYASDDGRGMGPNCGEQGTLQFFDQRPIMRVKLFVETLAKLAPILEAVDFRGQVDANCIVNETGARVLEITIRPGYPTSYIEPETQLTPFGELYFAVASGDGIVNKVKPGWALGVVMCGENYPDWVAGHKKCAGLPIYGVTADAVKSWLHPCDIRIHKDRTVLTGCYVGCVTASARSLWDCRRMIYEERIPKLFYPGMWFRHDLGLATDTAMSRLKSWGYDFVLDTPIESRQFRAASPVSQPSYRIFKRP